jgi:outer membrane protein assembly factor BamB
LFILVALIFVSIVGLFVVDVRILGSIGDSPQWRRQKQDALLNPQGGYVGLQAEGFDTSSLHEAFLSTNETGTWQNETTSALMWSQDAVFGFDNFGTATYKDGVLYAPSKGDDNLFAVNASNGAIIWNTTVRQCDGSPCIDGDVVYVGECMGVYEPTPQSRAMALNRTNGNVIWQYVEPNGNSWVGSPLVNGQYVYYTTCNFDESNYTNNPGVYALNKTNGNVLWQKSIGNIICSAAYDSGTILISVYNPPAQYALNATTGQQIWRQSYGYSWDTSPVIYGGMMIQVTFVHGVYSTLVLNETNGQLIRSFTGNGSTATPLVDNGNVFIPSNDWTIWAYNLTTGTELWRTVPLHNGTLQNYMYCSPAASGGAIYCQALNGTFYAINETDGRVLWSYTMGSTGFGSPSIGDGCVFITNDAGLYAFRIGPGSGDWPMFCHNQLHTSVSEQGVEYVRWPLTQPQYLGDVSNTWVTARFVWCNGTISSGAVAWKIYFFDANGNSNVTDIEIFYVNMMPFPDVAVLNATSSKTVVGQNLTAFINVAVVNDGDSLETFNVTARADATAIGTEEVRLASGNSTTIMFTWNTTSSAYGDYTIGAYAWPVENETNTANNNFTDGWVVVAGVGDLTGGTPNALDFVPDGKVDILDVAIVARYFGQSAPPAPSNCDVTGPTIGVPDGKVQIDDVATVAKHFGKHYSYL